MLTHALLLFLFFSDGFIQICFEFFICFCLMRKKYFLSKLMLLNFCCQRISFLGNHNFFIDEKHTQYLKELISTNRYKTKTKPYFCDHFYFKTWNYRSVLLKNHKKVFTFSGKLFCNQYVFYIINLASMDFLLDHIFIKRVCSSHVTLF